MKNLFSRKFKNSAGSAKASVPEPPIAERSRTPGLTAKTGLQPGSVVPVVSHPNHPHEHIALLATEDGLLIRPHDGGAGPPYPTTHVRVSWGKAADIAELPSNSGDPPVDWKESVVVYGIVGLMSLFNGNKTSSLDYTRRNQC